MPTPARLLATAVAGAAASMALTAPAFAQTPTPTPDTIDPKLTCVQRLDETPLAPARFRAHFGYTSTFAAPTTIAADTADNVVTRAKGDATTGHPASGTVFYPGTHDGAFAPDFDGAFATWTVTSPGGTHSDTATTAYADRCVYGEIEATTTADGAKVGWKHSVSGQNRDGLGHADWNDYSLQTCTLDGDPLPTERCLAAERQGLDEKGDVTNLYTVGGLPAGSTHTFRVTALAPELCTEPSENGDDCMPYLDPTVDLALDRPMERMLDLSVTFTVPESLEQVDPKQEPKVELPATPPVHQPQPMLTPPVQQQQRQVEPSCTKRTLKVTVPTRRGLGIRFASVRVDGKKLALKRSRGRLVATLPASSITAETVTVTVKVRYSNGKLRTIKRTVRTCA